MMMAVVEVMLIIIMTAVEVVEMMLILHLSLFLKFWKFLVDSAAELRDIAYDLAELIDKRSIFGLDSTINR